MAITIQENSDPNLQNNQPLAPTITTGNAPPLPSLTPEAVKDPIQNVNPLLRPALEIEAEERRELEQWRRDSRKAIDGAVLGFESFQPGEDERIKRRRIIRGVMDSELDINPESTWSYRVARRQAAQRIFGKDVGSSDESFFGALKERATAAKEKADLNEAMSEAALLTAVNGWGLDETSWGGSADSEESFRRDPQESQWQMREKKAAVLEQYGDILPMARKLQRDVDSDETSFGGVLEAVEQLDEEQLERLAYLLGTIQRIQGAKDTGRGVAGNLAEQAGRDTESLGGKMIRGYLNFMMDTAGPDAETDEDKKALADIKTTEGFLSEVRRFRDSRDPIRNLSDEGTLLNSIENALYATPGVGVTIGGAIIPGAGPVVSFSLLKESASESYYLRGVDAGLDRGEARELADKVAVPIAALQYLPERIGVGSVTRKLPVLTNLLNKLPNALQGKLVRTTAGTLTRATAETTTEEIQAILTEMGNDVLNGLKEDIPEADWDAHWANFGTRNLETFLSIAPYSAMGSMVHDRGIRGTVEMVKGATDNQLEAAGYSKETIEGVRQAEGETAENYAVKQLLESQDPRNSETRRAAEQEAVNLERERLNIQDAQRSRVLPKVRVSRDRDGFEVYDAGSGETIGETETAQDATAMVYGHVGVTEVEGQARFDELTSKLEAARLDVDEATGATETVEVGQGDQVTVEAQALKSAASAARINDQIERLVSLEKLNGGDGEVTRTAMMNRLVVGESQTDFESDERHVLNKLNAGSSVFTLVHERGHAVLKSLIDQGKTSVDELTKFFRRVDQGLAGRKDGNGNELQFLPDGEIGWAEIDEAVAEFTEVMLLRTRKGKKSKMRQLLGRNLSAMVAGRVPGANTLMSMVRAFREFFELQLSRHLHLKRAVREGVVDEAEFEKYRALLMGTTEQEEHEAGVKGEFENMARSGEVTDDNPFSIENGGLDNDSASRDVLSNENLAKLPSPQAEQAGEFVAASVDARGGQEAVQGREKANGELLAWAEEEGRLIGNDRFEELGKPLSNDTSEHEVWIEDDLARVVKRTWAGVFGQIPVRKDGKLDRRNASPSEYLRRQALQIAIFGSDLRFDGVTKSEAPSLIIGEKTGAPSMVISQEFLRAKDTENPHPSAEEIATFLESHGFEEVPGSYYGWQRKEDQVMIVDAKPDNFILTDKGVEALDLQISQDLSNGETSSFSLGDSKMVDVLAADVTARAVRPEARAKILGEIARRLQDIKREAPKIVRAFGRDVTQAAIVDPRTMKSLRKEAAMRQALRAEELETEILEREGQALAIGDAITLKDMPVHGFIARPGKKMAGGMMESKSAFMKRTGRKPGAEYEGSDGMASGLLYGGGRSPDQMALELHEEGILPDADPATMWERLAQERVSVAEMREQFAAAKRAVMDSRKLAKSETEAWLDETIKEQKRDHNPVARIRRSLAILDAIMLALPPELRGRVGGFVQLSKLNSDEKRLEFLKARIEKLDGVVESWLKGEFSKELDKVRKEAGAKRDAGKKPKGKLGASGHRFFDQVERVAGMTEKEVSDLVAVLEKNIADAGNREIIDLSEKIQIAHTFGNLTGKSAQEMERALVMALDVYSTKRNSWRITEEARLGNVRALVAQTIDVLGNPDGAAVQISKKKSEKAFNVLKNGAWDIVSFAEVMDNLLGRESDLAKLWSQEARKAFAARTKGITSAHKRWSSAIEEATGLKGRLARERVWEMQTKQKVKAIPRPETTSTVKVPIDTFFDAEKRASLGLTKKEIEILTAQFESLPKGSQKRYLTLSRTALTPEREAAFTESEAVYLSMLWSQEGYQATMTKHGFGEDFQGELEAGLSEAAKDLRQHLATEYADNYEPLRQLFAQMFGVDLPQVDHYTPGKFYSTGDDVTMNAGGEGFVEGGFQQGFLKDRKSHTAEPRAESAFSVYFNHLNQTEHWKALAPLSRELGGVFGNPKVKKALAARSPEASSAVNDWLKAIDGNGFNNPPSNKIFEALMSSQAYLALAWKLSTIAKNFFGASINGAYRMPVGEFFKGYGRLLSGRGSFTKLFESDLIQQRLAGGFAPEVRAAISKAFGSKPTRRAQFLRYGMEVIGLADGLGTAMGAAVTYDYHLRQGLAAGLSRPQAEAAAMNEAADSISRTAQPVEITDRSLAELRLHGLGKIAFVFASEARQKSAMWLMAWGNTLKGKPTKDDLRVLVISHFVMAPLMHGIGAALRDARNDDDDEIFDEENWGWEGFAKSVAVGPLSGLPLIRDVFDGFNGESGPLKRIVDSAGSLKDLFTEDPHGNEIEWYERKITKVLQGLDAFTAVSASVFDQVFDLVDNLTDD